MKSQKNQQITISLYRWLEYKILKDGEGFVNFPDSNLFKIEDDRLPDGFNSYSSSRKQWVCDSNVNALIPSGFYVDSNFIEFDENNFVDWNNGRVISTGDYSGSEIKCDYSTKEFNPYVSNDLEETIIFENKWDFSPFYEVGSETGINPYAMVGPACLIVNKGINSSPYSIGSSDFQNYIYNYRTIVITDSLSNLDSCLGLFMDQKHKSFPLINFEDDPFDEYGKIKESISGVYSYENLINKYKDDLIFIKDVKISKMKDPVENVLSNNLLVGYINFSLSYFKK